LIGKAIERALEELRTRSCRAGGGPDAVIALLIKEAYAELAVMRAAAVPSSQRQVRVSSVTIKGHVPLAVLADIRAHDPASEQVREVA
jgi:hypothetical protein